MKLFSSMRTTAYSHPVLAQLDSSLNEEELKFDFDPDKNLFSFSLGSENCSWRMIVYFDEQRGTLLIRSSYPIIVKDTQKLRVAELLVRLNSIIVLGSFQLDFSDGEVAFKTVHLIQEGQLDSETFKKLFRTNIQTTDEHFNPIFSVNAGFTEPVLAFINARQ